MKNIVTSLSEQQFLSRLDRMCTKHERFDKGYTELDVFVVKKKQHRFRIGYHVAQIALGRTDGYASDFVFGEYTVNSSGKVEVNYKFGKPFAFIIPFAIICIFVLPIFACVLYNTIFNEYYQWGGLFVTMIFSFIGLYGLFAYSKKDRAMLEEHLHKICFPKE